MKLSEYLKKERIQLQELCKNANITRATLFNLMHQGLNVGSNVLHQIQEATQDKVTMDEIYKEYIKKKFEERNEQKQKKKSLR